MYIIPKNVPAYSRKRLDRIMTRDRLRFNPYAVSDRCLLEIAGTIGWGDEDDITQIVTARFTGLRASAGLIDFDGIFMKADHADSETFIPLSLLMRGITADDTIRQERFRIDKRVVRNVNDVRFLVGKRVFISCLIRGVNKFGAARWVYRMHRLSGNPEEDAHKIRSAMCASKIEMLERILRHPECPHYLSCSKGLIDYETRIRDAIALIRRFPEISV